MGASLLAIAISQAQKISSCQGYTPSLIDEQNPYTISHSHYKTLPLSPQQLRRTRGDPLARIRQFHLIDHQPETDMPCRTGSERLAGQH
ncbi:hypothetical protein D3C76_1683700 [compost metagenome]